jgi:adenylate cyclase
VLKKLLEGRARAALLAALAVFAATAVARSMGVLQPMELGLYDRFTRSLAAPSPLRHVAFVTYTEADIQGDIGFPLDDGTLTRVLAAVLEAEPRAVGVDFYRDVPVGPGSGDLDALLESDPRLFMIYRFGDAEVVRIEPPPVLRDTPQIGFNDLVLDPDDVVRRAILFQDDEEHGTGLSLALVTALLQLSHDGVELGADPDDESQIRLGPTTIPRLRGHDGGYAGVADGGYQTLLRFGGVAARPRSVSMGDVLRGEFDPGSLRDRIVFLGVTAETHSDLFTTPLGQWEGVFLHGLAADQLVRFGLGETAPLRSAGEAAELAWILVCALLAAALALSKRSFAVFALVALAGAAALLGAGYAALRAGWWIPAAAPAVAWLGSASAVTAYLARRERAERADLMQLFSRHLSPDLAGNLWEHRGEFLEGGRPRSRPVVATAMFLDIRGFTTVGEKLDAIELMEWLNDFLGSMADEAARHGAIVDDYFGDGVKVDFGVPVPRRTEAEIDADAIAAVRCALAMGVKLAELNESWRERGLPPAGMRVGIATGEAVAGSIGGANRLKYTIVGDIVNVAARLESLDASKHDFEKRPCRILIAEQTRARLGDRFETRDKGWISVKGRAAQVRVHEVLGPAGTAPEVSAEEV